MSTKPPSRVVFVGNIPYTKTEEQIIDLFSSVGRVLNFRLVYDKETGRPKGFGFAEFSDPDTAASAVRNLNNMDIDGRKLRVDYSNESAGGGDDDDRDNFKRDNATNGRHHHNASAGGSSTPNPMNGSAAGTGLTNPSGLLPALPQGRDLPPGVTCADDISQTLRTLEPGQLLDFIRSMKDMALNDTERCIELLGQAPQLSYAVFQALLLMDLVSPDVIASVVDPNSPLPPPPFFVPGQQQQQQPPVAAPAPPAPAAVPGGYGGYGAVGATGTPPVVAGYGPPQTAPAAPPPAAAAPDTEQLMQAVLQLTDEQIDQLPPVEREQIKQIRASLGRR